MNEWRTTFGQIPIYKGGWPGHALFHNPFSDGEFLGRIRGLHAPVEIVSILSTIFVLNRCFVKPVMLNGKKPCNLAAFL